MVYPRGFRLIKNMKEIPEMYFTIGLHPDHASNPACLNDLEDVSRLLENNPKMI